MKMYSTGTLYVIRNVGFEPETALWFSADEPPHPSNKLVIKIITVTCLIYNQVTLLYCIPAKRFAVATTPVSLVGRVARERQLSHHQDDQPANEPVLELPINQVSTRAGHKSSL